MCEMHVPIFHFPLHKTCPTSSPMHHQFLAFPFHSFSSQMTSYSTWNPTSSDTTLKKTAICLANGSTFKQRMVAQNHGKTSRAMYRVKWGGYGVYRWWMKCGAGAKACLWGGGGKLGMYACNYESMYATRFFKVAPFGPKSDLFSS